MSIVDFIEKVQKKPKHVRFRILWLCVLVSFTLVISVSVISFKRSIQQQSVGPGLSENISEPMDEIKKEIPSLLGSLKEAVGAFFEDNPQLEESPDEPIEIERESREIEPNILPKTD